MKEEETNIRSRKYVKGGRISDETKQKSKIEKVKDVEQVRLK